MKIDLTGKVAIVTGAAGGIGRKTVALLSAAGASVIAEYRTPESLTGSRSPLSAAEASSGAKDINPTLKELENLHDNIITLQGEVAATQTAKAAVALAKERFGGVDILINNAGRTFPKPFADITDDDWDSLQADNVKGMFIHAREVLPLMIQRGGGTIVNVSSISSVVGMANLVAYCTSKGAVNQFTKSLAVELAPHNIRVNAVAPGIIDTPILDKFVADGRKVLQEEGAKQPLGRVGQPEEIANIILFLAASESSFMTGSIAIADGGYTAI
jgi:NAD(P)-dependent dehydrogenase (short-subunit alcohol dehydrogenase family)